MFTVLKVPKQCPLVLLVNVGCYQGKTSRSEEGKVMGFGLLEIRSRGKNLSIWAEFCV